MANSAKRKESEELEDWDDCLVGRFLQGKEERIGQTPRIDTSTRHWDNAWEQLRGVRRGKEEKREPTPLLVSVQSELLNQTKIAFDRK